MGAWEDPAGELPHSLLWVSLVGRGVVGRVNKRHSWAKGVDLKSSHKEKNVVTCGDDVNSTSCGANIDKYPIVTLCTWN